MTEFYSPLRYPGGKAALSGFLVAVLEHNDLVEPHYVEPYAGGAGAALRLLFEEYVESVTINDADPRIGSFWKSVTEYNEQMIELTQNAELDVSEWQRQRSIYLNCSSSNVLELGFATFYLNRTTRSGIVHNGGPIGGYNQSGTYKIDARFNSERLCERLARIGAYSDRITVTSKDGASLLHDVDRKSRKDNRYFAYIDPPYYVKGAELYMNRFSPDDHRALANFLNLDHGFQWIMSYDDVPEIRDMYPAHSQKSFYLSYSAYKRRRGQEVLIWPSNVEVPDELFGELPAVA